MKARVAVTQPAGGTRAADPVVERADAIVEWLTRRPTARDDAARTDRLMAMDRLSAALDAAKAEEAVAFADSQLAEQVAAGVSERQLGQGIAEQIGLARKMSPAAAARYLSTSRQMVTQMPRLVEQMRAGRVSSWVATLVVRETAELTEADRRRLDTELAGRLSSMSPKQASSAARRIAYRLDPGSILRRGRTAREDRRVSIRPAPDTMSLLTGLLPVEQGVAAYAALDKHARTLRATGDTRSLSQIMADTMVERLTGQATAKAVPVEIGVTVSLDALLGHGNEPAAIPAHGPVPTQVVRDLLTAIEDDGSDQQAASVFVRRLLTDPVDDTLVAIDSTRRRFPAAVARFITRRDQTCRSPYCDAPIRHLDHVMPHRDGGPSHPSNGQGLCERDNYAKEASGWSHQHDPGSGHPIQITTPTGHTYLSRAPSALGP
jgi:hypothetical protein